MSELISGKEAKIAWDNGETVMVRRIGSDSWMMVSDACYLSIFTDKRNEFKAKENKIRINGIEVPLPFEPKPYEFYFALSDDYESGYFSTNKISNDIMLGKWRTEEEIKQVVAALRSIFNPK